MAKSTYLELVNRVIQECGISGGSVSSVVGQSGMRQKVVTWVQESDLYIQRLFRDWNFLHSTFSGSTIASTSEVSKPSDLGRWDTDSIYVDYTTDNAKQLSQIDYSDYRNNYGLGTVESDSPDHFALKPNKDLILYPTPDAVYSITGDYWKLPTKLSANSDTSSIPEHFEDVIVHRAKVLYAQHEEAQEMFSYAVEEFRQALNDLIANELNDMDALNIGHIDDCIQVV